MNTRIIVVLTGKILLVTAIASSAAAPTPAHDAARRFMRGANFGNFLEAPKGVSWGARYGAEDLDNVRREGFDHVRLPVRWSDHAGPAPEHQLSAEIFARVDSLVTNALNRKLAVILNIHHFDEFTGNPPAHTNKLMALWRQIAAHYADAPESLGFEILNEPRDAATTAVMNPIYSSAIHEIRKTNPKRTIFVGPGRWNQAGELKNLRLPDDERNLIVTIHCYEPFYFTHQGATWSGPDTKVKGIQFPGPPATPLVPDPSLQVSAWVSNWVRRYNTETGTNNPSSPEAFRKQIRIAQQWSQENSRPVHMGEFGCFIQADEQSRLRFHTEFRRALDEAGMGWAIWDWKAGFRYWEEHKGKPMEGMREALFGKRGG